METSSVPAMRISLVVHSTSTRYVRAVVASLQTATVHGGRVLQELRLMGLPSVLDKDSQLNIPQLLNTTHRLMQLHHSRNMAMEELRTWLDKDSNLQLLIYDGRIFILSLQRGRSDVTMQVEIGERLKASHMTVTC